MRKISIAIIVVALAAPLAAQQKVDFWRIREGSSVVLVLGTGGECKGKVAKRMDGELSIRVSDDTDACGKRDSLVTVREENTRTVERADRSLKRKAATAGGAIGAAAGAGLLVQNVPAEGRLAALGGSLVGGYILSKHTSIDGPGKGFVIYVSKLG